jgi:hypothetical protein
MALPMKSSGVPIYPYGVAINAGAPRSFGTNPYRPMGAYFDGYFDGGFDPGMHGMRGMGGCGCGPVSGCSCSSDGLSGFKGLSQSPSLDSIIQNTASWLGSVAASQLPASAAVPPAVGSTGAIINTLMTYAPYLVIGYLAYKALK